jgi:hypothetical protein
VLSLDIEATARARERALGMYLRRQRIVSLAIAIDHLDAAAGGDVHAQRAGVIVHRGVATRRNGHRIAHRGRITTSCDWMLPNTPVSRLR